MKTIAKINSGILLILLFLQLAGLNTHAEARKIQNFGKNWKFNPGDIWKAREVNFDDSQWRELNLPHDWSVEGQFSKDHPATPGGGALPGGIGWYRKTFLLPESDKNKLFFIDFDGVYQKGEVWINGTYLGMRPYGYSSFRYELTPYLKFNNEKNTICVKVDNSQQPNSRWYSGSGIYRNVWLVTTDKIYVDHWGTFVTTPEITTDAAKVKINIKLKNSNGKSKPVTIKSVIMNKDGKIVAETKSDISAASKNVTEIDQELSVKQPILWNVENPYLYKAITSIISGNTILDDYITPFGIRTFSFEVDRGFILNGKSMKINGVCNHHDLGCLGAAINKRALQRQLEIMKEMGINGIRTSHNPPAPELLDLCDEMGFIVMDEAFDMWKIKKNDYDYHLFWDKWHKRDLEDMVLRDRNHPSVFVWSIGNEIPEQWDSSGIPITKELVKIVKDLDISRPVTSNLNDPQPKNYLYKSGALDLVGFSYHQNDFVAFPDSFPGQKFIGSETTSALATRGYYDMPSDSIRRWPIRWDIPFTTGNPDHTCSSYDNCSAPWGSTHEETLRLVKKYDYLNSMFIWTGFDYLGEPTPYGWPSRSSYFGIVDLAGFPKDAFYLYKSEWTDKPVLHIFPHWNWKEGDVIDVWAYTNFDEVELFLNCESLGVKRKGSEDLHLMWRVNYKSGTLKAVGKKQGVDNFITEIRTTGEPEKIILSADRAKINADGNDLSFVTVKVLDKDGFIVPYANNLINFEIQGKGKIVGVDNGLQTDTTSFKVNYKKAFNGLCLAVIQSTEQAGKIILKAKSEGLKDADIEINSSY